MSHAASFWRKLGSLLEAGERVFVALVVDNTRHSPGTVGARLLLSESGERVGTIGGGIMEHTVLNRAAERLAAAGQEPAGQEPELQTLHHRQDAAEERSGMICAGRQTNLYTLCRPDHELREVKRLVALLDSGRSGRLTISARGWAVHEAAPDLGRPAIELMTDGDDWTYREELLNRRRLAILGAGHCGLALAHTAGRLGFDVAIYDTREELLTSAEALTHASERLEDFRAAGERIAFPELTHVVVMTSAFPTDVAALAGVLTHPFPFIGVMGAPAKLRRIQQQLRDEGFDDAELERIVAPIGIGIPSHTPEEIAVSVAAQLIERQAHL
ncbi:MAG: XdhC family protein [Acidobacteriota bacterium]